MYIASVGCALPDHKYDQDTLLAAFSKYWSARHHNPHRVARFHTAVEVDARHLALPIERYPSLSFAEANEAFIDVGTNLGERAIGTALAQAGLAPEQVDAIFTTTVTGIATPSLDARLVNRLGLRTDIKRMPMFGLGCVAGAAGIARVYDYLRAYPDQVAVLLSVELCSLTLQRGDLTIPNLIASGLFGDGAACVVGVGNERAQPATPRVHATKSRFYPDTERVMGWEVTDTGFQIVLSAAVPEVVQTFIPNDVDQFLGENGLERDDIAHWVCHPGGPKVLTAMETSLNLPDGALARTWRSLKHVGNLSSASVLFVLHDTLAEAEPKAGDHGLVLAMGPGFCTELVLLKW